MVTMHPKLYKQNSKGKLQVWQVTADGATVETEWGEMGGTLQSNSYLAEAKNVGRANEKSPEAQAKIEAEAMFKKKMERGGYWLSPAEAMQAAHTGGADFWKPMKAQGGTLEDVKRLTKFPCYGQTKHDGFRCKAFWKETRLVFMSSRGVEFDNLPTDLRQEVAALLDDNHRDMILDGELEIAGEHRRFAQRAINGEDPGDRLRFVCYDIHGDSLTDAMFIERESVLAHLLTSRPLTRVLYSKPRMLNNMAEAQMFFDNSALQKQEGVILRNAFGLYEPGKRSRNVIKWKHWQDAEYVVEDVVSAGKSHEGLAMLVCRTPKGIRFEVTPEASHPEREQMLEHKDKLIGQKVTVKFQNFGVDEIPQHATAIDIRPTWDV